MSHVVTVSTQLKNEEAINRACKKLELKAPVRGKFEVFSKSLSGLGVKLPGWRYMVVIDTETGKASYDNYGGDWGDETHLNRFQQRYALEAAKMVAERDNQTYSEEYQDQSGRICFDIHEAAPAQTVSLGGESDSSGAGFAL